MPEPAETELPVAENTRSIEASVVTDFSDRMSYGGYLDLPTLLAAQRPTQRPEHHDELLFIIQHQTTELWLKLVLHELETARDLLRADELAPALKCIARVKHIQTTLTEQWSVLATLTPTEYGQFRGVLGNASGFQSVPVPRRRVHARQQERADAAGLRVGSRGHRDPAPRARGAEPLRRVPAPARPRRLPDPRRDPRARRHEGVDVHSPSSCRSSPSIYADPDEHWAAYETCEELVDLEDNFQLWRFRHLKTVERIIGSKTGTGGSSGAPFLQTRARAHVLPRALRRAHRDPGMTDVARRPTRHA